MKKGIIPVSILLFFLAGCAAKGGLPSPPASSIAGSGVPISQNSPGEPQADPILTSYYEGQSTRAYRMLQKSIFKHLLDGWTGESVVNPVWDYDTFTRYAILNQDMETVPSGDLYCCTFRADNGKYGYVLLSYSDDGPSLSNMGVFETAYPYDLQANLEAVIEKLHDAGIDLPAAAASRVRLVNPETDGSYEAVRITDGDGRDYLFRFDGESIGWI